MKNHYFFGYSGNKRNEVDNLYNKIKKNIIDKTRIIEPFCGTSALSYYISLKHPKKYRYILNDNNKYIIDLYKIASNEKELKKFINKLNELIIDLDKEKYLEIIKNYDLEGWVIKNRIYCIRPGLFPNTYKNRKKPVDFNYLSDCPIINFLRTEDIIFKNKDGVDIIKKYGNNDKAFIFIDPPYLMACNDFYLNSNTNIYEYFYNNKIDNFKSYIILCLENNWIIKLLFKKFVIDEYAKTYEQSKKKTTHLIISN